MRVPRFVIRLLKNRLMPLTQEPPDEIIGPGVRSRKRDGHVPVPKAFLRRWFIVPKNKYLNIYLHNFIRDDEDRALHDHPWWNLSCLLIGKYIEHTIDPGGVHQRRVYSAGDLKFRPPWAAHRVELIKGTGGKHRRTKALRRRGRPFPSWSLFITGPVQRGWGFHCPGEWVPHQEWGKEGCGDNSMPRTDS